MVFFLFCAMLHLGQSNALPLPALPCRALPCPQELRAWGRAGGASSCSRMEEDHGRCGVGSIRCSTKRGVYVCNTNCCIGNGSGIIVYLPETAVVASFVLYCSNTALLKIADLSSRLICVDYCRMTPNRGLKTTKAACAYSTHGGGWAGKCVWKVFEHPVAV